MSPNLGTRKSLEEGLTRVVVRRHVHVADAAEAREIVFQVLDLDAVGDVADEKRDALATSATSLAAFAVAATPASAPFRLPLTVVTVVVTAASRGITFCSETRGARPQRKMV